MPFVNVGSTMVSYRDTGAPPALPHAPTIVFGHGLLFSGWMFHQQIAVQRERYRCVTLDWRGQGDTPPAAGGYDMETLTGDAVALIRELGVAPVHWVGLSMGGFIGQRVAARHGELLRSLTLLDTSAGPEDPARVSGYRCPCFGGNLTPHEELRDRRVGNYLIANPSNLGNFMIADTRHRGGRS